MGIIIGIDEAGLGPNLGPFVVTAIAWEVPDTPAAFDWDTALCNVVTNDPTLGDGRLVIADSKLLFQPHRSMSLPECSVLAMLWTWRSTPLTLRQLDVALQPCGPRADDPPWLCGRDIDLPLDADREVVTRAIALLAECPARIRHIECRIVQPSEFNQRLRKGNKAEVTSEYHMEVLAATCRLCLGEEILIVSDKHGGRNSYRGMLSATFDGAWIDSVHEGPLLSTYRIGPIECRFEPRAERHWPVAMASMISKYVREAHMRLFNRFWAEHLPDLRPTQGYPDDARRFAAEISACQKKLRITMAQLWRVK